jgi:hypothetical protein
MMKSFPPARTTLRLLAATAFLAACSRPDKTDTADSAAADTVTTATTQPAAPAAASPANNTPASLTPDDIDRWQKGMDAELEAVRKAGADLKAAKTSNDTLTAMMAANEMSTRDAGAKAAGVDPDRYQLIRTTLSSLAGEMSPIEQEMNVKDLPASAVEGLKKSREASLAQATANLSPDLVKALEPRAAALRKQSLTLTAERLKASGMAK